MKIIREHKEKHDFLIVIVKQVVKVMRIIRHISHTRGLSLVLVYIYNYCRKVFRFIVYLIFLIEEPSVLNPSKSGVQVFLCMLIFGIRYL